MCFALDFQSFVDGLCRHHFLWRQAVVRRLCAAFELGYIERAFPRVVQDAVCEPVEGVALSHDGAAPLTEHFLRQSWIHRSMLQGRAIQIDKPILLSVYENLEWVRSKHGNYNRLNRIHRVTKCYVFGLLPGLRPDETVSPLTARQFQVFRMHYFDIKYSALLFDLTQRHSISHFRTGIRCHPCQKRL